jgi:pimeloyl-ACP methyl ester carboxylesterase
MSQIFRNFGIWLTLFSVLVVSKSSLGEDAQLSKVPHAECIMDLLHVGLPVPFPEDAINPKLINYKILGEEHSETVILIHGLGGSMKSWGDVAPELAKKYRVLAYDQRGHGKTPAPNDNFSSAIMATDLRNLMDYLHIERAHIIGHSMGGRTAVRFAASFPERTNSLLVEDMHMIGKKTRLPSDYELSRKLKLLDGKKFKSKEEAIARIHEVLGRVSDEDMHWWEPLEDPETHLWEFLRTKPGIALWEAQGYQEDLTTALVAVQAPKIFLAADPGNWSVLLENGIQHIQENSPGTEVIVVPDSDHSIHKSQFAAFIDHAETFIAQHTWK